jgi:hypothetical protein
MNLDHERLDVHGLSPGSVAWSHQQEKTGYVYVNEYEYDGQEEGPTRPFESARRKVPRG